MTFKELQDSTLSDRFKDRTAAKAAINFVYGAVLALEKWAFLRGTAAVSLNAAVVTLSAGVGLPTNILLNSDGDALEQLDLGEFERRYLGTSYTGEPEAFTAVGDGTILVGPTPDSAYPATILYEQAIVELVGDGDVPVMPDWTHLGLVAGAQGFLAQLENDATYAPLQSTYQGMIDAMRRRYLVAARNVARAMPRDPLAP